jgi:hypothetical protein
VTTRLGQARLKVRVAASLADDRSSLRDEAAHVWLPRVLAGLEAEVYQRLGPQARVSVGRLRLRWRTHRRGLHGAEAEQLGRTLAQDLLLDPAGPRATEPDPASPIVVFASEAEQRAVLELQRARGEEPAWYHPEELLLEPLADWVRRQPEAIPRWLEALVELEAVEGVLARLEEEALRALAAAWPVERWPTPALLAWTRRAPPRRETPPQTEQRAGSPRETSPQTEDEAAPQERAAQGRQEAPEQTADPTRLVGEPGSQEGSSREGGAPPGAPSRGDEVAAAPQRTAGRPPERGGAAPVPDEQEGPQRVATRFGGLVYLVGRILELDLAEALFFAGFDERQILAHTFAALIEEWDPLPLALAGVEELRPLAPVQLWQLQEVQDKVKAALQAQVERRVGPAPWLPAALSQAEALLLERVPPVVALTGAAAATLFGAALGLERAPELSPWLAVGGDLVVAHQRLVVTLPMERIDLDLRRAGLDRDPGWVPWLGARVEIVFRGGEE